MQKGLDYTGITTVFLCHDGKGRFVMNRRSTKARDEHGRWDIGGGGLKFGERIEDCLRREIKEEYCADIQSHEFLGFRDVHRQHEGRATHWIGLDFLVLVDPLQVAIGDPVKMEEIKWFTLTDLPAAEEIHSQFPAYWEKYQTRFNEVFKLPQTVP